MGVELAALLEGDRVQAVLHVRELDLVADREGPRAIQAESEVSAGGGRSLVGGGALLRLISHASSI